MFDYQMPGVHAAAIPGPIVAAWARVGAVALLVTFVGWWRRRSLDLRLDASLLIVGCFLGCLVWCAIQCRASARRRPAALVIPSAHGQVSVPDFKDAVPR
jgi:hypothetical protein